MEANFNTQDGNHLPLQNGLPEGFRGNVLQGALASHAENASGLVILQNYQRTDFTIQLGIFKFIYLVKSVLHPPELPIVSILSLKNDLKYTIRGIGSFSLKEKEFSFLNFADKNIRAEFEGSQEYHLLEISWSPEIIAQTVSYFPTLADQFKKAIKDQSASIIIPPRNAGKKAIRTVQDILNSPFEASINEAYFENKIREYLLLLMVESSKTEEPRVFITKTEKEQLLKLGERLKLDPAGKFPIGMLANEMNMNEIKFKLAFKQVFGKGIFEFHLDQRMKEAHRLLKESHLPIKMVATMTGYNYTTNFIIMFRKYFGYPPSRIQKKS
jgi:AraC family transcriptional activator of pyochelin receptor